MPGDKEGPEYMWICSWIMLKYSLICLKQSLTLLYKLHNNYRYTAVFKMLPNI